MFKSIQPTSMVICLLFTGCSILGIGGNSLKFEPITTGLNNLYPVADIKITLPEEDEILNLEFQKPDQDGNFELLPGFSEITVKSYCINAGNSRPGKGNGYGVSALEGEYAEVLNEILHNSAVKTDIWQQDVQQLIWALLAKSNIKDLHPNLQKLAYNLLSPLHIKHIQKNALKVYSKSVLNKLVEKMPYEVRKAFEYQNELRHKLSNTQASYAEIEAFAVPESVQDPVGTSLKKGDWFKHPDGYYTRVFPDGYQKIKIQYFNPLPINGGCSNPNKKHNSEEESCSKKSNPSKNVAVPANNTAQRIVSSSNPANTPSGTAPDSAAGLPEEVVKQLSAAGIDELNSQPDVKSEAKKLPAQTVEGNKFERRITDLLTASDNDILQKMSVASGISLGELKSYKIAHEVKIQLHNCGYFLADQLFYKDTILMGESVIMGLVNECKLSAKTKLSKNQSHFKLNMETKSQYKVISTNGASDLSTGDFTGIEIRYFMKTHSNGKSNGTITVLKLMEIKPKP